QDVAIGKHQGLARDLQVRGDGRDGKSLRHHRLALAPWRRFGDRHARQQAALRLRKLRVGTVLGRIGCTATPPERHAAKHRNNRAAHGRAPVPLPAIPIAVAAQASTATMSDSTSPAGMLAQASRACTSALKNPSTHVARSSTKYHSARPLGACARTASSSAQTSATAPNTSPPTISQEAKLLHWISWLRQYA